MTVVDGVTVRNRRALPRALWILAFSALLAFTPALAQERPQATATARTPASETSIRGLLDAGRYQDAEQASLTLVNSLEPGTTTTPLALADAIDLLLESRRRANHASTPGTVDFGQRALRIKDTTLDAMHPGIATTLHELGYVLRLLRRTKEARPLIERALAIRERAFGPDSIEAASTTQLLALTDMDVRDFTHADEHLRKALAIAERVEGPQGLLVASTCHFLGVAASFQTDFAASVRWLQRAIDIYEHARGPDFPDLAASLERLASSNEALGDLTAARDYYERAIALSARTAGTGTQSQYFRLLQFSILLGNMGEMREAIARGDEAVAMAERLQGPESPGVAVALGVTATTRHSLGDYAGARARIDRAMAIWRKAGGSGQHVGEALGELAALSESEGRPSEALSFANDALAAFEGSESDVRIKATVLETRGRILSGLGRYEEARSTLDEARRLNESRDDGELRSFLAQSLLSLATVDEQLGHREQAIASVTRAIELFTAYHGADHPNVAVARGRYAQLLAESGDVEHAWSELETSERLAVAHVRLIGGTLPEREALRYSRERPSGIGLAMTMATMGGATVTQAQRAWTVVTAGRGVVLDELAARHHDEVRADVAVVRNRVDAFVRARTRLANLVVRGPDATPPQRFASMLAEARTEREAAEQALADVSRPFRDVRARNNANLGQILDALATRQAIVAYVRYSRAFPEPTGAMAGEQDAGRDRERVEYAAFVVTAGGAPRLVRLGAATEVESLVTAWRAQIDAEIGAGGLGARRLEATYRQAGAALRRRIWDPLAPLLGQASAVFVVPDGALHLVDLAALPVGTSRYLIEMGPTIHYLLAERDLIRVGAPPSGRGLLVMGAPDFDRESPRDPVDRRAPLTTARMPPPASQVAAAGMGRSRGVPCEAFARLSFPPLGDAGREARTVGELWRSSRPARSNDAGADPGSELLELTGRTATETAFKTLAPGRRVLHLATHGFFLDGRCATAASGPSARGVTFASADESPLLRAGLALAGANRRTSADEDRDDGILTAEEITAVDLSGVEWAVLSACNTGVGDWVAGEGVLGLRRAFEMAGARTVIMSLWPVGDAAAAAWMARLYRERFVAGARTLDAVRAASRGLLREARARGTSTHPARWAGFIAAGEWR